MPRLAIFEDNALMRHALQTLLSAAPDVAVVGAFADASNVVADVAACQPDVVLMDIDLPGRDGIWATAELRRTAPAPDVLMLTVFDDDDRIFRALCAGASGYLLKNALPEHLIQAIADVVAGGAPMSPTIARRVIETFPGRSAGLETLSPREREVLTLLARGLSYKLVAAELGIGFETVRTHIKRIYEKLHVHSVTAALAKWRP